MMSPIKGESHMTRCNGYIIDFYIIILEVKIICQITIFTGNKLKFHSKRFRSISSGNVMPLNKN